MAQQEIAGVTTDDFDTDVGLNFTSHATLVGKADLAVLIPFKAGTPFARDTPKATIDAAVCDYDGYADPALTWTALTRGPDGRMRYEGTTPQLRATGSAHPNMVGGFTLQNAAKTKVYMVFNIPNAGLPLRDALDAISAQLNMPPSGTPTLALTV